MADEEQVHGSETVAVEAPPTDAPAVQAEAQDAHPAAPVVETAAEPPKTEETTAEVPPATSDAPPALDPVAIAAELARARAAALAAQFTAGHTGGSDGGEKRKYEFDPEEEFNAAKRLNSEVTTIDVLACQRGIFVIICVI